MLKKSDFLTAHSKISQIENLINEAQALYSDIELEIQEAIEDYHGEDGTNLPTRLYAAFAAVEDVRLDWAVVVSELECEVD